MTRLLEYRAGPAALARIRSEGFATSQIRTLIAPASGPKWLVAVGFDRALLRARLLEHGAPVLLAGASAGAWRCLAYASPEPLHAHERLLEGYVSMAFGARHTPQQISDAYRALLNEVLPPAHASHALAHPSFQLAIHAVRARGAVGSPHARVQQLALGVAALGHALHPRAGRLFLEPTLFTSPGLPEAWLAHSDSRRAALEAASLHEVALASGTVPLYMAPVALSPQRAHARYIDGGFGDYHVRQPLGDAHGLSLLFSHQRRVVPAWFDKYLPWRAPAAAAQDRLLLVYPSASFMAELPGGQVPTRDDFTRLRTLERIARWRAAAAASERLGQQLLEDLARGRVPQLVQPL